MTTLVVRATGATGSLLVEQLINRDQDVRVIVRSRGRLLDSVKDSPRLAVIEAAISDLTDEKISTHVSGCRVVASCLGHTLSFRGVFGPPRRLVTDAVRRLCLAIKASSPAEPVRFVLMSAAGIRNHDLKEQIPAGQKLIIGLLRGLVPPHADNEAAAAFLRNEIGQIDNEIEWAAVRPDTLIDEAAVSTYNAHASPTRSAIFNAGRTSRINVAHFVAELVTDESLWQRWCGQMPVVYNQETSS